MQQPFVMGESSVKLLADHLNGKSVPKNVATDVLTVTRDNISKLLPTIQRNVLGQTGN
jgi:ABC-type sugar transport system substrate-binding protein